MKHCKTKYYIPKTKDIECDLLYVLLVKDKIVCYVYNDGTKIKSSYKFDSLRQYYTEIPEYEAALLI